MGRLFDNPVGLLVLLLIVVVIFGANKLPDAARSLGRSMRVFKSEVEAMHDDDKPARRRELEKEDPTDGSTAVTAAEPAPRVTDDQTR